MMECTEVLDEETLQELRDVAGDELNVVLQDFLNNGERHEARLLQAQNDRDWETVASVAHDIKGGYGYLGANQLLKVCMAVLSTVRGEQGHADDLDQLTVDLMREFQAVRVALTNLMKESV